MEVIPHNNHTVILQAVVLLFMSLLSPVSFAEPVVIEEIVVTAQKREQSLGDLPLAVSVVTGDLIEARGTQDLFDLANSVPALQVYTNSSPLNTAFRLRGIGNEPNIPNFEPAVGLYIDGVYMPRTGMGVGDLVDIERIEIIKGPQSTLYGKSVTAGLIHIITRRPSKVLEGKIETSLSSLRSAQDASASRFTGYISGPLTDSLSSSLTAVVYDQEGTDLNITTGERHNEIERYALRGKLDLEFGEASNLLLSAFHSKLPGARSGDPDFYQGIVPAFLQQQFNVPCANNDPLDREYCLNGASQIDMESNVFSATLEIPFGALDFTSITAYNDYAMMRTSDDIDQMNLLLARFVDTQEGDSVSQELRLASPSGERWEWMVGGYYQKGSFERGDRGNTATFELLSQMESLTLDPSPIPGVLYPYGTGGDLGFLDSRTNNDYSAAFGQTSYQLSERLILNGGLRYGYEKKETSINNSSQTTDTVDESSLPVAPGEDPLSNLPPLNLVTLVLSPSSANTELERSGGFWTWNAALQYYAEEDAMLYFNYARGAKSGGFNSGFGNTPISAREFDDEYVDHYEFGSKLSMLDNRLAIDTSVFLSRFEDFQSAGFVSLQFLVNNAEEVESRGVEVEGRYAIDDGLTASFGLIYQDARFVEYTGGSCYPGKAPDNQAGTACDLSGYPLPVVPEWKSSLGLQYDRDLASGTLVSRIDWTWQDDVYTNSNLDPRNIQQAFSLLDARIGWRKTGLEVSLWVKNLTDETYVTQSAVSNLFGADPAYQNFLAKPREVGVSLRYQF